jgi:hypothetical protein
VASKDEPCKLRRVPRVTAVETHWILTAFFRKLSSMPFENSWIFPPTTRILKFNFISEVTFCQEMQRLPILLLLPRQQNVPSAFVKISENA